MLHSCKLLLPLLLIQACLLYACRAQVPPDNQSLKHCAWKLQMLLPLLLACLLYACRAQVPPDNQSLKRCAWKLQMLLLIQACLLHTCRAQIPTPQTTPLPPPPLPGCTPVLVDLGYTCPVGAGNHTAVLNLIASGGLRTISQPVEMVLKEYPGYPRVGSPEVNFTLPAAGVLPGDAVFLNTGWFRENGVDSINLSASHHLVFPIFYSRVNDRWEPLEICTHVSGSGMVKCEIPQGTFRREAGLRLLVVNAMSESREAVYKLMQDAIADKPDRNMCIPVSDQFSSWCPSSMIYSQSLKYGSGGLRSAMAGCNLPFCFLFPANSAHFHQVGTALSTCLRDNLLYYT